MRHEGRLHAFEDRCPHAGALLSRGAVLDGCVTCPVHEAQFRLDDGRVLRQPAKRDLHVYDVAVEGTDVYVRPRPGRRRLRLHWGHRRSRSLPRRS